MNTHTFFETNAFLTFRATKIGGIMEIKKKMGVEKIGLEMDDSARSSHFSKNYPDEQQKTPPNQLMVRRRRLLELIIPFHYLREVGPALYLKGPYVTNG